MLGSVSDFKSVFIWEMVSVAMILILESDCESVYNWEIISLIQHKPSITLQKGIIRMF